MSVQTVRAGQTTYPATMEGGTRDPQSVIVDIAPFMDAIEDRDTHFLNSLSKGKAVRHRKHDWGMKGVNPRGSVVAEALANNGTTLKVPTGHGVRFQQGHVLLVNGANGREIIWVVDDPAPSQFTIRRGQGGTTPIAFVAGDSISIIGIAMPQLSDFPLAPVSRGRRWWNFCQEFSKHIEMSDQNRYMPDEENPSGDWLAEDMLQLGKDIRLDLNNAAIFGRRQAGSPDPSDLEPAMMGGLIQFAEMSGNVYDLAAAKLSIEAIDTAMSDLEVAVGRNKGDLLLMSLNTKQIFNRLLHPFKYQSGVGVKANSTDLTWDSVTLETGTYKFNHMIGIPDDVILIYSNKNVNYSPYVNLDWKEKTVPTKGNYSWKGISGTFTMEAKSLPGWSVIKGFDSDQSSYPSWGSHEPVVVVQEVEP